MTTLGTVFQLKGSGFHIRVVISNPKGSPPRVLVCNFTDVANCLICDLRFEAGAHEWITKQSTVAISKLETLPVSGFALAGDAIRISPKLFNPNLLQEIQQHILASDYVSEFLKSFLR